MTIYQLTMMHAEHGACVSYHGTKAEARKQGQADYEDDKGFDSSTLTKIEFKPTKAGILEMLNTRTPARDNG